MRSSVVGFLDLLGFSQQVVAATTRQESERLLNRIVDAISDSKSYVRQLAAEEGVVDPQGWAIKYFSDNLTLGYAFDESDASRAIASWFVIRCAQRYQLRMALNGLFLRGGLTIGPLCITDEIIFGAPLIASYRLESNVSIVPRIILDEPLQSIIAESIQSKDPNAPRDGADAICRDVDGWWFVNYLQAAVSGGSVDWNLVSQHKASVLSSLKSTTRHDVLPKYGWACRYHNMFCHWYRDDPGFDHRYHIDRSDEHSSLFRFSDQIVE